MKTTQYKYKFSFVIPVYNVEPYLAETVESVLAQDMSFERDIEIIFVNDGSTDSSEDICLRYQLQYPENIHYIKQKNLGLSTARNNGARVVQGKYTMFLDSDDKISSNTTPEVYDFFEKHYEEIDFVALKFKLFGGTTSSHVLNFRFTSTRVIDITTEFDAIQIAGASVFIKSAIFHDGYRFDESIKKYGEDTKFLAEVVIAKMAYGVVHKPTYYYRQRRDSSSIMSGKFEDGNWYLRTPRLVDQYLFDYSKDKVGYVPKYIQYIVAYDLQWRIKQATQNVLDLHQVVTYKKSLWQLLKQIDVDIIMAQRHMNLENKLFLLKKKSGRDVTKRAELKDGRYYDGSTVVYDPKWRRKELYVDSLEFTNGLVIVRGYYNDVLFPGMKLRVKVGDKSIDINCWQDGDNNSSTFLGETIYKKNYFEIKIPLQNQISLRPYLLIGESKKPVSFVIDEHVGQIRNKWDFHIISGRIVIFRKDEIIIQKKSLYRLAVRVLKQKRQP